MLHKIQCMHLTGGYSFIFLPSTETSRYYSFLPFFCIFLLSLVVSHLVVHKVTKVDWSLRTPKSLHIAFAFPKSKPSTPGVQNSKLSIIWFISRFLSKPQQNLRITLRYSTWVPRDR